MPQNVAIGQLHIEDWVKGLAAIPEPEFSLTNVQDYVIQHAVRVDRRDPGPGTCRIVPTELYDLDAAHPTYVNPMEPVHEVMNLAEFHAQAVSIHIYSKPFDSCEVYYRDQNKYADVPLFYTSEYGELKEKLA